MSHVCQRAVVWSPCSAPSLRYRHTKHFYRYKPSLGICAKEWTGTASLKMGFELIPAGQVAEGTLLGRNFMDVEIGINRAHVGTEPESNEGRP